MEMPAEQLTMRMMSSLASLDQHKVRTGDLDGEDFTQLHSTVNLLSDTKMFIDDTPALTPAELRALNKKKYSFIAKFWHWGFVLLFIYGVAKQVDEIEQLEDKFFFQFQHDELTRDYLRLINLPWSERLRKRSFLETEGTLLTAKQALIKIKHLSKIYEKIYSRVLGWGYES